MTTYLTIITTVLVLMQIIRVTQNWIQLRKMDRHNEDWKALMRDWEAVLDRLNMLADKGEGE